MELHGKQFIGSELSGLGNKTFHAFDPQKEGDLAPAFMEATEAEIHQAVEAAQLAFPAYRALTAIQKANFLDQIGAEIMALGDELIQRGQAETALPAGRLQGERGRTINQLKLFASVVREGSWVDARIDPAQPDRQPMPRADIRQLLIPMGPVAVFGASNFPLAFSVAGGDTASALAAGCPVVVKAHPAHPGTCELVATAILRAAEKTGMPAGVFSMVHGPSVAVGQTLVTHPLIKAVGFTGSFRGGKALFDAAMQREEPIPVYAEMGSTNPVFLLPGAVESRAAEIATGLAGSVVLGVGQFCTNPGLVLLEKGAKANDFGSLLKNAIEEKEAGTMLTPAIRSAFTQQLAARKTAAGVVELGTGKVAIGSTQAQATVLQAKASRLLEQPDLAEEVFGPASILVSADSREELLAAARSLQGHLTATIHGTEADLLAYQELISILQQKVGRLVINGFPTGVEVGHSMVHGGPFPATTDSRSTSVGTLAIKRFARPFCYQSFPDALLPPELQADNPMGIWRMTDGEMGKA